MSNDRPHPDVTAGVSRPTGPRTERATALVSQLAIAHPDAVTPLVPLRDLTTLRIGGPALGLCRVRTPDDARRFLDSARAAEVPVAFLGGGSNVLADDLGFGGCLLRLELGEFTVAGDTVLAGAGLPFDTVITRSLAAGLTGLEFASGIPGSVGGAVVGNAGCFGREIAEFLTEATLLRATGRIETVGPQDLAFGYRRSALQAGEDLLLSVRLRLGRGDMATAERQRETRIAERRRKHPVVEPCAGSWFKNLPPAAPGDRRRPAGELLDQVGAKSLRVGDAGVFAGHANIIVNLGHASAADVRALVGLMREAVARRFGVRLVEEVRSLAWTGFTPPVAETDASDDAGPRPDTR